MATDESTSAGAAAVAGSGSVDRSMGEPATARPAAAPASTQADRSIILGIIFGLLCGVKLLPGLTLRRGAGLDMLWQPPKK
jgi:hypothetical protein